MSSSSEKEEKSKVHGPDTFHDPALETALIKFEHRFSTALGHAIFAKLVVGRPYFSARSAVRELVISDVNQPSPTNLKVASIASKFDGVEK
jgi:hypothetical protein